MPKKKPTATVDVPLTGDVGDLITFWRQIVSGRLTVEQDDGTETEVVVPIEVRIRASELLAKHVMPKNGRFVEEEEEEAASTPDILRVAQMLENKIADAQLAEAFAAVRKRKGS